MSYVKKLFSLKCGLTFSILIGNETILNLILQHYNRMQKMITIDDCLERDSPVVVMARTFFDKNKKLTNLSVSVCISVAANLSLKLFTLTVKRDQCFTILVLFNYLNI